MQPELYPVFLKLAGLRVVVVGGGPVAASKLAGLLAAGARVTVVAPAICDEIRALDATRVITRIERPFVATDLDGARWVVAAATPAVNREVAAAAHARGLFVNAVDDVASASAYLGGVVRRGSILLAISTNGLAPALAGLLREALEAVLPDELERWIDVARRARADWKHAGVPMPERRPLLLRALDRLYARPSTANPATSTATATDAAVATATVTASDTATASDTVTASDTATDTDTVTVTAAAAPAVRNLPASPTAAGAFS